jgi:tetraacyldisaccharide 4'-kinase
MHWGGTGKTPVVAAVAAHLASRGLRVAVLSRGYGRRTHGPRLVSDGGGPLLDPWQAGDEPWLLAASLAGVAVAVGERRRDAGELALAAVSPSPQVFVLDDGFSHLALARELDLLVLPAEDPFGGGRLPPRGRLREPLGSAARAAAALLVGAESGPEAAAEVAAGLRPYGFAGPVLPCPVVGGEPRLVGGAEAPRRPLLVTGIANPERVRRAAARDGLELAGHLAFADHHRYPPRSVRRIHAAVEAHRADGVATTSKDVGKLRGRLTVALLELPVAALPDPGLWPLVDAAAGLAAGAR